MTVEYTKEFHSILKEGFKKLIIVLEFQSKENAVDEFLSWKVT